jgi:hypothetical protein
MVPLGMAAHINQQDIVNAEAARKFIGLFMATLLAVTRPLPMDNISYIFGSSTPAQY